MKFGKRLIANATPEWQPKFFDYKSMKKKIKKIVQIREHIENIQRRIAENKGRSEEDVEFNLDIDSKYTRQSQSNSGDKSPSDNRFVTGEVDDLIVICPEESYHFLNLFEKEIDNINSFFQEKEKQFNKTRENIATQVQEKKKREGQGQTVKKKHLDALERAFQEYYRGLVLLDNYRKLNYAACIKILKKYSKYSKNNISEAVDLLVRQEPFIDSGQLDEMFSEAEEMFSDTLYSGERKVAMNKLRPHTSKDSSGSAMFRCGIWLGVSLCLTAMLLYYYIVNFNYFSAGSEAPPFSELTFFLFRMLIFPIAMSFFISINIYIWEKYGVNYVFIFELNPRNYLSVWEFMEIPLLAYILWGSFMWFYMLEVSHVFDLPNMWLVPFVLFCVFAIWLLLPLPILRASARWWMLKVICRVLCTPLLPVKFKDFWFANQLTSLSDFLYDLQFVFCMHPTQDVPQLDQICSFGYSWGLPIINLYPNWCRFMQCCRRYYDSRDTRQAINAGKYFVTVSAMLATFIQKSLRNRTQHDVSTAWLIIWFSLNIFNMLYKLSYDVCMDWGLFRIEDVKYLFLRKKLMFPFYWYYIAILIDVVLRFLWITVFFIKSYFGSSIWSSQITQFCIALAEIIRRCTWNVFRVENEHLSNVGKFRAVTEIPLPFDMRGEDEKKKTRVKFSHRVRKVISKLNCFRKPNWLSKRVTKFLSDDVSVDETSIN
ncbi:hypothetical protein AKO1_009462 [Acrasis kona]|uniref:Uncharacterized protein n=1 Tax=Acrasis kona TaxID=1008807 RepID=A0AAW2ZNM2_9EUKA